MISTSNSKIKSKGIFGAILAFLLLIVSGAALAGCSNKKLTALQIDKSSVPATVFVGQPFNKSTIVVNAVYSDGTQEALTSDKYVLSGTVDTSKAGVYTLTVTYSDLSDSIDVTVRETTEVERIEIDATSVKTSIYVGEDVDTSKIQVFAIFADGAKATIPSDKLSIDASKVDTQNVGTYQLVATFGSLSATIDIQVSEMLGLDSIEIEEATYAQTVSLTASKQEYDLSGVKVLAKYKDGSVFEFDSTNDLLQLSSDVDSSTPGTYTLTATYENCKATKKLTVAKDYTITGFFAPKFVDKYNQNSQQKNTYTSQDSDDTKGFTDVGNPYVVGDDNAFVFEPTLEIIDKDGNSVSGFTDYQVSYQVLLDGTQADSEYVTVDSAKHTLTFSQDAIGKTFTILANPKYRDSENDFGIQTQTFTVNVIDGYNVYTTAQFSILDNENVSDKWTSIKQQNGIPLTENPSAIILHDDIHITKDDIPSIHFWSAEEVSGATDADRALGSLKDSTESDIGYIYRHKIADGGTFTLQGNYFQINVADKDEKGNLLFPLVVREKGKSVSSSADDVITVHTKLLRFDGDENYSKIPTLKICNLSAYGNTQKAEDATMSGGVIFEDSNHLSVNMYNCLVQRFFINLFAENSEQIGQNQGNILFDKVNAYDAFNTILYNWVAGNVTIKDSNFIGAGGPVLINDCSKDASKVTNVTNDGSVLESWVAGTEGWFVAYNATGLATNIKGIDQLLKFYGKTMLDSTGKKMNLISVHKNADTEGLTSSKVVSKYTDTSCTYGLDLGNPDNVTNAYIARQLKMKGLVYETAYQTAKGNGATDEQANTIATEASSDDSSANANFANALKYYMDNSKGLFNALVFDSGAVGAPGTSGWYSDENGVNGTPDATLLGEASKIMSIYIANGMGAVLGISNNTNS